MKYSLKIKQLYVISLNIGDVTDGTRLPVGFFSTNCMHDERAAKAFFCFCRGQISVNVKLDLSVYTVSRLMCQMMRH